MLNITKALRDHMVKSFGLAEGATDDDVRRLVIDKQMEGKLELTLIRELATSDAKTAVDQVKSLDGRVSNLEAKFDAGIAEIKSLLTGGAKATVETPAAAVVEKGAVGGVATKAYAAGGSAGGDAGGVAEVRVDVKSVVECYDDTRTAATWDKSQNEYLAKAFGGRNVAEFSQGVGAGPVDMPTNRSLAITGAWFKHLINKQCREEGRQVPWQFRMTEHDRKLCQYAAHESRFVGPIGYKGKAAVNYSDVGEDTDAADQWCEGVRLRELSNGDYWTKAILDDSTSGGLEAVPIEFDANFILTPLLNSQLFPLVDQVTVTRRRQEGVKIGNPTMTWGTSEGTPISLFNTDGFITAFDTNIYPVTGALELGKDFMSDSPLAIGQIVQKLYGERFKQEMDNVIANGNGTNRPEGLFIASGVSTVSPAVAAGAPQVGDYEGLMFGVGLEFLQEAGMPPNSRAVFLGTQTAYQRARSIPVDSSADARRIFGIENEMSYTLFGFRYAINASAGNAKIGFFCLNRYRLYRRAGLEIRMVRDDRESMLRNTELIVCRARFGGALTHSSAGTKITNAQA